MIFIVHICCIADREWRSDRAGRANECTRRGRIERRGAAASSANQRSYQILHRQERSYCWDSAENRAKTHSRSSWKCPTARRHEILLQISGRIVHSPRREWISELSAERERSRRSASASRLSEDDFALGEEQFTKCTADWASAFLRWIHNRYVPWWTNARHSNSIAGDGNAVQF